MTGLGNSKSPYAPETYLQPVPNASICHRPVLMDVVLPLVNSPEGAPVLGEITLGMLIHPGDSDESPPRFGSAAASGVPDRS